MEKLQPGTVARSIEANDIKGKQTLTKVIQLMIKSDNEHFLPFRHEHHSDNGCVGIHCFKPGYFDEQTASKNLDVDKK